VGNELVGISTELDLRHFGRKHRYSVYSEIADRIRGKALRQSMARSDLRMACLPGDHVSDKIIAEGLYEKQFLYTLVPTLIENSSVFLNSCFLDVGANIGNHSCFLSKYFAKVIAFEPNPAAFHILAANIYNNNLQNIEPVQLGLGAREAILRFLQISGNLGASAFGDSATAGVERFLQVVQGDRYLEQHSPGMPIGFVKIDVQGFEREVIEGLAATLSRDYPLVLFENELNEKETPPLNALKDLGYTRFFGFHESYFQFSGSLMRRLWKVIRNHIQLIEISDPRGFHDIVALR